MEPAECETCTATEPALRARRGRLRDFLRLHGLERHFEVLVARDVDDLRTLALLSHADLQSIGLSLGHAVKLARAARWGRISPEVPQTRWDDVGGLLDQKRRLQEIVLFPREQASVMERFGLPLKRPGVLLFGPAGCGKALLAKAVATESSMRMVSVPRLDLDREGDAAEKLRSAFDVARAVAPCVIFISELDTVPCVSHLLTEIDAMARQVEDVLLICATAQPQALSEALLKPGRLEERMYIPYPDLPSRQGIFEAALRCPVASNVSLHFLAQKTDGFSGAEIVEKCKRAAFAAARDAVAAAELGTNDGSEITRRHFEEAFAGARRAMPVSDLARFHQFRVRFCEAPASGPLEFHWPDDPTPTVNNNDDDEDDLYA